jgi:hypothetical protein
MKKFILILIALIIFTGLQSQELVILKQGQNEIIRVDSDTTKVKFGGAELITIKLLMKYKAECFNDSCQINVYIDPNTTTEIAPGIYSSTLMMGYYKKVWKHKEPTFSDFIDWLSKEYGL